MNCVQISFLCCSCLGIGATKAHASKDICELVLEPNNPSDSVIVTTAVIVVNLPPHIRLYFRSLPLADQRFDETALGADACHRIMRRPKVVVDSGFPSA